MCMVHFGQMPIIDNVYNFHSECYSSLKLSLCVFLAASIKVIAHLLKPRGWKPPVRRQFFLDCNEIADLCDSAERIFSSEPSVLQLKAPIKIFGDLHGQFGDLMRLFDEYGAPSTAGDIA